MRVDDVQFKRLVIDKILQHSPKLFEDGASYEAIRGWQKLLDETHSDNAVVDKCARPRERPLCIRAMESRFIQLLPRFRDFTLAPDSNTYNHINHHLSKT